MEGLRWWRQNTTTLRRGISGALGGIGKGPWKGGLAQARREPEQTKGRGPTGQELWQGLWVFFPLTLAPVSSTELFPVRERGTNEKNWGSISWVLREEKGRGLDFWV